MQHDKIIESFIMQYFSLKEKHRFINSMAIMKHFIEAIYYQYYLYYKRSKYDWKISPEESACWALGFSFFFPLFNFCAFIFLCILHEINYHWYYLIPFYIGWIGVNKICEKNFFLMDITNILLKKSLFFLIIKN